MLKIQRKKARMRVEWLADSPNFTKIQKLHKDIVYFHGKVATETFNLKIKVAQMLTKAQRQKLMTRRFRRGFRWRRGFGGP